MNVTDVFVLVLLVVADIALIAHLRIRRMRRMRMEKMMTSLRLHLRRANGATEMPRRRRLLAKAS